MNSQNFLIILGLFSIIWQKPDDGAMAQPVDKKKTLYNYDDEAAASDYFQIPEAEQPREKKEEWVDMGQSLFKMPSKPVLSEDDAELALMSDMSIYTDDDVAWEHEHGRSGIFRGFARDQKLRSPPVAVANAKKPMRLPAPMPIYPLYPQQKASKPAYARKNKNKNQKLKQQNLNQNQKLNQNQNQNRNLNLKQNPNPNQNQNQFSYPKNFMVDYKDMSIGKWNWMEKILRQQAGY